jgi:predicted 3-demethylubiquinone-9 3-methyltransferase (glyoxalase superfamily)
MTRRTPPVTLFVVVLILEIEQLRKCYGGCLVCPPPIACGRRSVTTGNHAHLQGGLMTSKAFTTCLWFDTEGEEAANYYTSIFKDSKLGRVGRYTEAGPGPAGSVMAVEFELNGQRFVALNGGPQFTFNEAISFQIFCEDQAEVDHYWRRLAEGGQEVACGWLQDKYGLSWQVIPTVLIDMISDPDPQRANQATQATLAMTKFDIAALQKAYADE